MTEITLKLIDDFSSDEKIVTEVFAELFPISQREYFSAIEAGFKPEYKLMMWEDEYSGEEKVIFEVHGREQCFKIYRSFVRDDGKIELYVQKKAGVFSE